MSGMIIIMGWVLVAVFADWLATHSPIESGPLNTERLLPPSRTYWFGTDDQARDIYSRVVHGSRTTLLCVALVAALAMPIGLLIGMTAGYAGGWIDRILMRLTDIFLSLPRFILALALVAAIGPGIQSVILAMVFTMWPACARVARTGTVTIRRRDHIAAARLQGASAARIIRLHILPLCLPSVMVRMTLDMSGVVIAIAGLGFLGLGVQPPWPEWGEMISTGRRYMIDHWWVSVAPGLSIFTLGLGFNLLGDGLCDVLDPGSRS